LCSPISRWACMHPHVKHMVTSLRSFPHHAPRRAEGNHPSCARVCDGRCSDEKSSRDQRSVVHLRKLAGWRGVVLGIVLIGLGIWAFAYTLQHADGRVQGSRAVAHRARDAACGGLGRGGTWIGDRRRLADRLDRRCRSLTTREGLTAERRGCVSRRAGLSLGSGAILRPTPGSGAHAAGRSGGKGSLEPSGCRSVLALSRRRRRERELRGRRPKGSTR
jgi:hypothetical protein